jgi:hypothetical protein
VKASQVRSEASARRWVGAFAMPRLRGAQPASHLVWLQNVLPAHFDGRYRLALLTHVTVIHSTQPKSPTVLTQFGSYFDPPLAREIRAQSQAERSVACCLATSCGRRSCQNQVVVIGVRHSPDACRLWLFALGRRAPEQGFWVRFMRESCTRVSMPHTLHYAYNVYYVKYQICAGRLLDDITLSPGLTAELSPAAEDCRSSPAPIARSAFKSHPETANVPESMGVREKTSACHCTPCYDVTRPINRTGRPSSVARSA